MTAFIDLPNEVLIDILWRLELPDRKRFRLVSSTCEKLATPQIFDELPFDLEPGGCDGLAAIANSSRLKSHVRTVRLERRAGLKTFPDFHQWEDSNVYQYDPMLKDVDYPPRRKEGQYMSRIEWESLSESRRKDLHQEYRNDEAALKAYASRLLAALSTLLEPNSRANSQVEATDAEQTIHTYRTALNALSGIHSFMHTSAFQDDDQWGRTWRTIEFHPEALSLRCGYDSDPDIEALQLFIALRTAFSAQNSLKSVQVSSLGSAFWGAQNLCRLLIKDDERYGHSVAEDVEAWVDKIASPLVILQLMNKYIRGLVAFERGFSGITRLECRIDTRWSEGTGELESLADGLSNILKEAVKLEQLDLVFRAHATTDHFYSAYFKYDFQTAAFRQSATLEDAKISRCLLLDPALAMQGLRRLKLSIATGAFHLVLLFSRLQHLRHLQLFNVTLFPNAGQWDTVFESMARHLALDQLDLCTLEDVKNGIPRLLLNDEVPIWKSCPSTVYREYKTAIIDFALRRSTSSPLLDPEEFISRQAVI